MPRRPKWVSLAADRTMQDAIDLESRTKRDGRGKLGPAAIAVLRILNLNAEGDLDAIRGRTVWPLQLTKRPDVFWLSLATGWSEQAIRVAVERLVESGFVGWNDKPDEEDSARDPGYRSSAS